MSFEKGQSGNPNGRPKGAKDKATKEIREKIASILEEHFTPERVTEDLEAMEPKERLMFLSKLLDYAVPKLKQTDIKADVSSDVFTVIPPNFELDPEDRKSRIKELKQKLFESE
jgi:vacuolar-type H+-ATPase subunit E/Vma4